MITKNKTDRTLLFDGPEAEIHQQSFNLGLTPLSAHALTLDDLTGNSFEQLSSVIGQEDFDALLETSGFQPDGGFLNHYKSEDRLKLYYLKQDNHIAVFSFGEFQPTRYQLYLEGTWTIGA